MQWSVLTAVFAKYAKIKKFYFEKPSLQAEKETVERFKCRFRKVR